MADYTLSAKITGDSSGFEKAIQGAEKSVKSFEERMKGISSKAKSIGDKLSGIGVGLTAGVTAPLALAGKSAIDAASDFDENLNKIDVAFGNSASEVRAWADTATESFGLSKNQALEATSLFGDMATSMGLSQGEAASMATSMAGLAGDLASFKNVGIDQAMTALNGVFTGETESLKQLGIVMTETNLEEFAAKTGQVYSEMSQAEKVQLRYNYVMAMSKNAVGDYARTSDGTANSMRTFQASVANLAVALGQNLLPIITPIIQKATEMVNAFANADPELQQLVLKFAGIAAAAGPVLMIIGKMVSVFGTVSGAIGMLGGKIVALGGMKAALSGVFTAITGPVGIAVTAITALVGAFAYLMQTNEGFRNSIMNTISTIGQSLMPVIQSIITVLSTTVTSVLQALAPVLAQIVTIIGKIIATMATFIAQLVSQLAPILTTIIQTVGNIVSAVLPPVLTIINAIMKAIQQLLPPITSVLTTAISVISKIISAITPIVSFVAGVIADVIATITPIISFIADVVSSIIGSISEVFPKAKEIFENVYDTVSGVWENLTGFIGDAIDNIGAVISEIKATVSTVFDSVYQKILNVMNKVKSTITRVFNAIENSWNGLKSFVGEAFGGISGAVESLVSSVKGFINGVISGINSALSIINKIPGVSIGSIPYLAHGTSNWQGGFAYMNEGGRGELTYLPNGSQVIPHDISVKYAKEAARTNRGADMLDLGGILEGVVIQIINNTNVDGTPLMKKASEYTIREINERQRGVMRLKGAY